MQQAKTGMTSVTFRKKTAEEIIELVKQAGLQGIEWGGDIHVPVGQLETARRIGDMTRAAGLEVFSYGSYYELGQPDFEIVAQTAQALGCHTIRVWGTKIASADCTLEDRKKTVDALLSISDIAEKYGMTVAMEWHNGTINDYPESSLALLEAVNRPNIKTYWQPLYDEATNLSHIRALEGRIANVHIYNWIYGEKIIRKTLADDRQSFAAYVQAVGAVNYIMEFVKDDSPEVFLSDAKLLKELVE